MKMMTAIFASSDGCTPSPANPSHRVAPLRRGPNSTATSAAPTMASVDQMTAGCR